MKVVRGELEIPAELAGLRFDGDDGIGIEVVAEALVAVVVGAGIAGSALAAFAAGSVACGTADIVDSSAGQLLSKDHGGEDDEGEDLRVDGHGVVRNSSSRP
ncbi:MAG: hypothetical protein FJW20_17745 [Acidimicrobiia bacterium]|nr:hypothetical protein [Acidimicrobiia bacterium]